VAVVLLSLSNPASNLQPLTSGSSRLAYFEFGVNADTLYLADPAEPWRRQKLLVLPHASDFGLVPSLAPDARRFAYAALPPNLKAPSPDTPADLWLASVKSGAEPDLLARGVDLLVPTVWSADGRSLVYRRSRPPTPLRPGEFRLFALDLKTGIEKEIAHSEASALFPIAFVPGLDRLYYVELGFDGSRLAAIDLESGARRDVALLSDGITRDWALSPAGDRLAYLVMQLEAGVISSRAHVLDLATGVVTSAASEGDAFSPKWTASGELVMGSIGRDDAASGVVSGRNELVLPAPDRGFDVPLAAARQSGAVAVRAFDGVSAMAPGHSVLAVLTADGQRTTIATGEVTFLGWIE
jgi:hypothetical protein